jgi:hypothetical protein
MELFFPKDKSVKPATPIRTVKPNLFKSKLNKTRNTIKTQKNYLNSLYNDITSSSLKPTDHTYSTAATFNHVRNNYEFMAGPYKRQGFPSNEQIQARLNYIKTNAGQQRLAELQANLPLTERNVMYSTAKRIQNKGKKQLLNKIRNLEFQEVENIATELKAMPTGGGAGSSSTKPNRSNSTYSTENMVVVGSNPGAKGGYRNCTYKKSLRQLRQRKTHRKRRN